MEIFTHLKLCLATATHNYKWVKITKLPMIWIRYLSILIRMRMFAPSGYQHPSVGAYVAKQKSVVFLFYHAV